MNVFPKIVLSGESARYIVPRHEFTEAILPNICAENLLDNREIKFIKLEPGKRRVTELNLNDCNRTKGEIEK